LSLWTGALWGKPMWGTWWVWDARLTSELILFFLYLGFIALQAAIDDPRRADKAGACWRWWRGEHSHHLFLGEVVEHPAPGLASVSLTKSPVDGADHALGHAADGAGLLDVFDRRGADAGARHHPGTRTAHGMGRSTAVAYCAGLRILRHGRLRLYVWGSPSAPALLLMVVEPILARHRAFEEPSAN
jgi:hypothetical protein